ncbi:MAG TPA: hypothetical protein EYN67_12660 [Flavobacteriales bacterium]|nr:hypothetical protein [Methylococcaceae bacterium]HHZ96374.1 hypothetical protein [Flavobacteriales bacterium]
MIRFTKTVQLYQDTTGKNAAEGVPVRVLLTGTTTEATVFSDDAGTIPLAQPFLTNLISQGNPGQFTFVVSDGTYDIEIDGGIAIANEAIFSPTVFIATDPVLATTLGTVVKRIEIFDFAGASLGFIPVYDAIT